VVLVRLLEEFPGLGAWVSFSCRDGAHTCEGERISECAAALRGRDQIWALGLNCTPPRFVPELLENLRAGADKPLMAYPNSGEGYDARAKQWTGTPECTRFADHALEWYRSGARLIGGCCRTTPQDIRELRAQLRALDASMV
jgi:homocysteine S-methyltransferase